MKVNRHIKRIVFIGFWCLIGTGVLVLLVAAMKAKEQQQCSGVDIEIHGSQEQLFVDSKEVEVLLTAQGAYKLNGRAIRLFDLRKMEESLKKNVWISEAQLFFDNNHVLQVNITEREPVARVFTMLGNSFYLDTAGVKLPLSDQFSVKLPVFTGFPNETDRWTKKDSALVRQVIAVSAQIRSNPFIAALVAQADINAQGEFELIPVIGKQVIELGTGTDLEKKFRRLDLFYRQVVSKTGTELYDRIKIQYAGQVVGVKRDSTFSRYDSLQAVKNVQRLILLAQTEQERWLKRDSGTAVGREAMEGMTPYPTQPADPVDTNRVQAPAIIRQNN